MDHIWAIAFISAHKGLIHMRTYTNSLDHCKFEKYVEEVSEKMQKKPFALFMDGASYHKSKDLDKVFAKMNIRPIINVPYCP